MEPQHRRVRSPFRWDRRCVSRFVSVDQERERRSVHAGRALDEQRRVVRLARFVEVAQVFTRELHVRVEVVGAAMRDRFELAPAPRKEVLHVDAGLRVMRTLARFSS